MWELDAYMTIFHLTCHIYIRNDERICTKMNLVFMAKLDWRFLNEDKALWVQLLRGKYIKYDHIEFDDLSHHKNESVAWKGTVNSKFILNKGIRSLVGNRRWFISGWINGLWKTLLLAWLLLILT